MQQKIWHVVRAKVAPEAGEAVESAFNSLDSLGTSVSLPAISDRADKVVVEGYFTNRPPQASVFSAINESLRITGHPAVDLSDITFDIVEERDWLGEWKKSWQAVRCGRFVIAPPWDEQAYHEDAIVIRIEPGMAFGTGTHETTQLCLAAIENNLRTDWSVLDVGTGTGILAIAAAHLHGNAQRRVIAIDNDPAAVRIAAENARLNGKPEIAFVAATPESLHLSADLTVANLTLDVILPMLRDLIRLTKEIIVLSGILATQQNEIISALQNIGLKNFEIRQMGEWISVLVRLNATQS